MDVDAHHNLAVLFRSQGDEVMHARHSRIAWLTQCGGPKVWNERALALMHGGTDTSKTSMLMDGGISQQQALDEAWRLLQETMNFWPSFYPSYTNAAALLSRRGRYAEALPFCIRAVDLAPGDSASHRNAARVYEQLGRPSEAMHHYRQALALAPDDAEVARRLALLSLAENGSGSVALRADNAVQLYSRHRLLRGEHYDLKL